MGRFYEHVPVTESQKDLSPLMQYEVEFTLHRLVSWDRQELCILREGLEALIERKSGLVPEQKSSTTKAFIPECSVCGEPGCPDHM